MQIDLNKKIKGLRGEDAPKSFPMQKEIDKLPKNKSGQPDISKLERETIGNVIFNCVANYIIRDKREGHYINLIAQSVLSGGKVEFKDKIQKFLMDVLDEQTLMRKKVKNEKGEDKEEVSGLYHGWVIAQISEAFGEKIEE